jgi:uncharacterized protein YbbC (DUF1343 family)
MPLLSLFLLFFAFACQAGTKPIETAAQQLIARPDLSPVALTDKTLALVVNQSSRVGDNHLLDLLLHRGFNVKTIFSPEHGFRGTADAGAKVDHSIDPQTGLPLLSLYGAHKKPTAQQLQGIELLIFDLQDVGVRYYTYLSTLHYLMEAAAEQHIPLLVLDRPNPNGAYLDGPVLEKDYSSFVGLHPIPLLHGMTLGELAQMIKGEGWIHNSDQLQLYVWPVKNYQRQMRYDLPVRPSPNLPNAQAVALYPSLGFFEATPLSIGRGTNFPFQVLGYTNPPLGCFAFSPVAKTGALQPPLKDQLVLGLDLRQVPAGGLNLRYLIEAQALFARYQLKLFNAPDFMDKLSGTNKLRQQLEQGWTEAQIRQSWQAGLQQFRQQRRPYLLYPE